MISNLYNTPDCSGKNNTYGIKFLNKVYDTFGEGSVKEIYTLVSNPSGRPTYTPSGPSIRPTTSLPSKTPAPSIRPSNPSANPTKPTFESTLQPTTVIPGAGYIVVRYFILSANCSFKSTNFYKQHVLKLSNKCVAYTQSSYTTKYALFYLDQGYY